MKILIDQSVFLFLKENKISVSKEIAEILSSLKRFPKMYPRIASADNIRHFFIKNIKFGYMIDKDMIIITDCKYIKSNKKLKIKKHLNKLANR